MGKGVEIVWLQTSNWKGLTIDIPMDQKAYSPRHLPCDRRHLTVLLLIPWGCVLLLVPDCIKGHEPLFSQARLRALIGPIPPMYYHPHTYFYVCSSTAAPLAIHDVSSALSVSSDPRTKRGG